MTSIDPLLSVERLRTSFYTEDGEVEAVNDISFEIRAGETLGIVGESGSGKSVTALSIMRLLEGNGRINAGRISLLGRDLVRLPEPAMRQIRGKEIGIIFQEPMTSLNPVFSVGQQVTEAIRLHQRVTKSDARRRTIELFREVGILNPEQRVNSYPHQLSGGQKQRVMIAMALSCNPQLLIADEPTTALDVTIQAQILDILRRLRDLRGMAILFITHDLGVIAEIADHVAVMLNGRFVEHGRVVGIFADPKHPYTRGLLACRPRLDSPYRRLPTVADFMERRVDDDGVEQVVAKAMSADDLQRFSAGRPRRWHPRQELAALHHTPDAASARRDISFVPADEPPLLRVENLKVHFPVQRGMLLRTIDHVRAVDGVSVNVYRGQTLGIVGESGCGKTTLGRAILRLIEPTDGRVEFDGVDLATLPDRELRAMKRRLQIVFQDPYGSMNPRKTIESIVVEPMVIQKLGSSRADRRDRAVRFLEEVGLKSEHLRRYPHEFSGGQRQRICIARALAVEPEFLICDESVSALDVSVQAQVLNLLNDLQVQHGLTYIFISHDLSVVEFMADMVAVMCEGKIVEFGPSEAIYREPREDYTRLLIAATPNDSLERLRIRQSARDV